MSKIDIQRPISPSHQVLVQSRPTYATSPRTMISQRARYAFKALIALARAGSAGMQIRDIAEREQIPRKFLEQILLSLKAGGLIASRRGREGGYALLKNAETISLGSVLRMVDGPIAPLPCLSRTAYRKCDDCQSEELCAVRAGFAEAYDASLRVLEATTIAQAVKATEGKRQRRRVPASRASLV
jgi:Rrf2 family protein